MDGYHIYKKGDNATPHEDQECATLVEYLELRGVRYSHIHHEMYTTSRMQKAKMKRLGVKSGVPDYIICFPGKLLFIEMKREKGGRVSDSQAEWIESLNGVPNVRAVVCYGFDEARKVIDEYLANPV